jgi:hypothetical protein
MNIRVVAIGIRMPQIELDSYQRPPAHSGHSALEEKHLARFIWPLRQNVGRH